MEGDGSSGGGGAERSDLVLTHSLEAEEKTTTIDGGREGEKSG